MNDGQCPNCGVWLGQRAPRVGDIYLNKNNGHLYRVTIDWSSDTHATAERIYPPVGPSPCAENPSGLMAIFRSALDEGAWLPVPAAALTPMLPSRHSESEKSK